MTRTRTRVAAVACALAVSSGALLSSGSGSAVRAQEARPTRVRLCFPPIGPIPGETIRVGVASLRTTPPPIGEAQDRVRIRLLDARGQVVADSGPLVLQELMSEFLSVERERLGPGEPGTGRVQVRAVVIVSNPDGLPLDPVRAGVELLDTATGRTTAAVAMAVDPQYPPGPSAN